MIKGHGDDAYLFGDIRSDFSSNISPLIDTCRLRNHLAECLTLISHYPEPAAMSLEKRIATELGIAADEVLVTSGATDAIYLIAQTLRHEHTFAVSHPTFSEYLDACRMFDYEELLQGASVRWICNPNNPTGEVQTIAAQKALASRHRWLIIDQSYEDCTFEPMLIAHDAIMMQNVIQVHSMTKRFAIPGLRLGYVVAPATVINRLRANHRPWAVNALAIEAGLWLMDHQNPHEHDDRKTLLMETQRLADKLHDIPGLTVLPTATNFMLCQLSRGTAAALKEELARHHGILIRDASNFPGLTPQHFRIATQTPAENDALIAAIRQLLCTVHC